MSFGISSLVQGRVGVFHLWAANVRKHFPGAIVSVAYSENYYKDIIEIYGFEPVLCSNSSLSRKANASCMNLRGRVSKVLFMGSDDVVNLSLAHFYQSYPGDFAAFKDCYFHNLLTSETLYWPGYEGIRQGEPIGAGKIASSYLLEMIHWQPFGDAIKKGLDSRFNDKVNKLEKRKLIKPVYKHLVEVGGILIDIKTKDSLTPWNKIKGTPVNITLSDL